MTDFQENKALVRRYFDELDNAEGDQIAKVLNTYTTNDYLWRGMHPFHEQSSAEAVADIFWKPLQQSFRSMQRRQDVFMAGANVWDGVQSEWVCAMGHLMGLFDQDWLGIPASGKLAFLRYVEFNRITEGKISETALFVDIIGVMQQVGLNPLPLQTGASIVTPGPRTHDGLMFDKQDPIESKKTIDLIKQMIDDLISSGVASPIEELRQTWLEGMLWWGPAGIGATYTLKRYQIQHQSPFRDSLEDIVFEGHVTEFSEGNFGGFFGWPSLTMKNRGGFMGLPASDFKTEMRVVDIYRRKGDKLAENWIFIDLLHFLYLLEVDVLGRMKQILRR